MRIFSFRPGIFLLDRYLLREVFRTAVAITAALLLLILVKLLMQQLGYLMEGKFSSGIVITLLAQKMVTYFVYVLPLLVLLSVVVALGRLSRDSEMTALFASRYSQVRILWPLSLFGIPLIALLAFLALEVSPGMAREAQLISHQERLQAGLDLSQHGRFLQPQDGRWGLHARTVEDGAARDVFFASYDPGNQQLHVEFSSRARQTLDAQRQAHVLHFEQGRRYSGWPGEPGLHSMEYEHHQLRIAATPPRIGKNPKYWSWRELQKSDEPAVRAERQWRLSLPVSLLLLLLLAVPLSRSSAREGKYARATYAIVIYLAYVQMQLLVVSQVRNGQWSVGAEVMWVHLFLALCIGWWYYVHTRRHA